MDNESRVRLVVVTIPEDIHHFPGEGDWRLKSLSDKLHGQNFMPHHIRKIVGLLNIQSCLDIRKPQCNGSRHYITCKVARLSRRLPEIKLRALEYSGRHPRKGHCQNRTGACKEGRSGEPRRGQGLEATAIKGDQCEDHEGCSVPLRRRSGVATSSLPFRRHVTAFTVQAILLTYCKICNDSLPHHRHLAHHPP